MIHPIAVFPKIRRVIETDEKIIIPGHQNVAGEHPEEQFLKSEYWVQETDTEILIFKR